VCPFQKGGRGSASDPASLSSCEDLQRPALLLWSPLPLSAPPSQFFSKDTHWIRRTWPRTTLHHPDRRIEIRDFCLEQADRIALQISTPPPSGRRRSIKTTSGGSRSASARPVAAVLASPTTWTDGERVQVHEEDLVVI